jgi:hypothetical protein
MKHTWLSHNTSLIIVSDLAPDSLLLGSFRSKPNTGISSFTSSTLDFTKIGVHYRSHKHHLGNMRDTSWHQFLTRSTTDHRLPRFINARHSFGYHRAHHSRWWAHNFTHSWPFPSLFLVYNTYAYIYSDFKHVFSLFHLYLSMHSTFSLENGRRRVSSSHWGAPLHVQGYIVMYIA